MFNVFFTKSDENAGFVMCWDNVQVSVQRRHQSTDKSNRFLQWALAFVALNRVPAPRQLFNTPRTKACDMPTETFLPTSDDWLSLRLRMEVLVARMLIRGTIPALQCCEHAVDQHILHEHTQQSAKKSVLVCIGISSYILQYKSFDIVLGVMFLSMKTTDQVIKNVDRSVETIRFINIKCYLSILSVCHIFGCNVEIFFTIISVIDKPRRDSRKPILWQGSYRNYENSK